MWLTHTLNKINNNNLQSLDGRIGKNRAPQDHCQINADNDISAIQTFLKEYQQTPTTQRNYQKEIERLLLWSVIEINKSLSDLNHDDMNLFLSFLLNPPEHWTASKKPKIKKNGDFNPDWRPLVAALKPQSAQLAMVSLNSFFSWLADAGYLVSNPVKLIRKKLKSGQTLADNKVERYLDKTQWQAICQIMNELTDNRENVRLKFIIHLLFETGLRVHEAVNANMNHFKMIRERSWMEVTGKGGKTGLVPVNQRLLTQLSRYRLRFGFMEYPSPGETQPLLFSLRSGKRISQRRIHQIIKALFEQASTLMDDELKVAQLKQASPHWLRHTSFTYQIDNGVNPRFVQKNARHNKLDTTMRYVHADEAQRHEANELW